MRLPEVIAPDSRPAVVPMPALTDSHLRPQVRKEERDEAKEGVPGEENNGLQ